MLEKSWMDPAHSWWRSLRNQAASEIIPTWQVGQTQENDRLFQTGRYAHNYWAANSLFWACVNEVATAFAALMPVVEIVDDDRATPYGQHRGLEVLSDPIAGMSAYEWRCLLVTQYLITGNVYIEKIRRTNRRSDRITYPVKELGLINPEYVKIKPGITRDADVFQVWVDGAIRREIPREDIIHIRTPNLINDFYGFPPPATLESEGMIDSNMNLFHVAFYRNAGVPFGLLSVNKHHTTTELKEIKSKFREAVVGVKRWFDVLVLNADEAKYTALGIAPNEMESDKTRDVVESRICAVFGVPPIIVGALVGLKNNRYSNFSQAQASFYSETVLPLSRHIASDLQIAFIKEFATSQTSNAMLRFDASEVRALREVNLEALVAAGEAYATGVVNDHTALRIAGFSTPSTPPRFSADPGSGPASEQGTESEGGDTGDDDDDDDDSSLPPNRRFNFPKS